MHPEVASFVTTITEKLGSNLIFGYVYGSGTGERFAEGSDIDVGLYLEEEPENFLNFYSELSRETDRKVDVLMLKSCDPIIARQVLETGEVFVDHDPDLRAAYTAQKISEYIDFKRSRYIVEQNLMRGKIDD